jgi:hypothetical protein
MGSNPVQIALLLNSSGALAEMVLLRRFERPVIEVRFLEAPLETIDNKLIKNYFMLTLVMK